MADALGCSAGCKRTVADMAEASGAGWELLPISQRWRCPDCTRELEQASSALFFPHPRHSGACEQCGAPVAQGEGHQPGNGMVFCSGRCYGACVGVPYTGSD